MDNETDRPSAWQETGAVLRFPGTGERSMQCSSPSSERQAAGPTDMARLLTPCLTLVAPVGMDGEQQATWAAAAFKALEGYSVREIEAGAQVAMRKADHPSKIVPLIVKEIEAMGEYSRDTRARPEPIRAPERILPAPPREIVPPEETQAILRSVGLDLSDVPGRQSARRVPGGSDRSPRVPSPDDYKRLFGIDVNGSAA